MSHDYITLMWLPTRSFPFAANTLSLDTTFENKMSILEHFEILTFKQRDLCSLAVSRQSSEQEPLQSAERTWVSAKCFSRKLQRAGLDLQYLRSAWVRWIQHVSLTHLIILSCCLHMQAQGPVFTIWGTDAVISLDIWLKLCLRAVLIFWCVAAVMGRR